MRVVSGLLCAVLLLGGPATGEDAPRTAADVTEPGRSLERALDVCLAGAAEGGRRTVVFLVDPTPSLATLGFADAFEAALARLDASQAGTALGVAGAGAKKGLLLEPTTDRKAAAQAVRTLLAAPSSAYQDLDQDLRRVAGALGGRGGARDLVLVTLENGDAESDLEGAAQALRRAHVRLSAITQEAFLSDSFWISSLRQPPRGLTFGSGDAPWQVLPWGWLLQQAIANEVTPSGFGPYALGYLAAETGGRVFLTAAPSTGHLCTVYGTCPFCSADHAPTDDGFQAQRLRALAPSVASRKDAGAELARDPCVRVLLKAWAAAEKEGLLRSRPAVRLAPGGLKEESRHQGTWPSLLGSDLGFARLAGKADKLVIACGRQIEWLDGQLGGLDAAACGERSRAMAELTLVELHLLRLNLLGFAAWCREVAPAWMEREAAAYVAPEISPLSATQRVGGIGFTNMSLCHGVQPFFQLRLPGGEAFQAELRRFDEVYRAFQGRWGHTPFALALRRQGLAQFLFTYRGTITPVERPRTGSDTEKPTTETGRPSRAGSPSSGGGSTGPTTGGG